VGGWVCVWGGRALMEGGRRDCVRECACVLGGGGGLTRCKGRDAIRPNTTNTQHDAKAATHLPNQVIPETHVRVPCLHLEVHGLTPTLGVPQGHGAANVGELGVPAPTLHSRGATLTQQLVAG
jgi:hypothetical protein